MKQLRAVGLSIGVAVALAGCHQTVGSNAHQAGTVPPPPPALAPTQCDAQGATWAEGQHATERVTERARMASGAQRVRVVRPGEALTMEFDATRLNLEVDEGDVIRHVRCG